MVQWLRNLFSGRTSKVKRVCDLVFNLNTGYGADKYEPSKETISLGVKVGDNIRAEVYSEHAIVNRVYVDDELVFEGGRNPSRMYEFEATVFEEGDWIQALEDKYNESIS